MYIWNQDICENIVTFVENERIYLKSDRICKIRTYVRNIVMYVESKRIYT